MCEERQFYCERIERNCPFESRFRYCFNCTRPVYLIKRTDQEENLLYEIVISDTCLTTQWTKSKYLAYRAENEETAQAIIDCITNIFDADLGEQLEIEATEERIY